VERVGKRRSQPAPLLVLLEALPAQEDGLRARAEAAGVAAVVLDADGLLVALPVLAAGGIGDQVVEPGAGVAVVRQDAAVRDVLGVAAVGRLHVEVRLGDRPGLRV
jgi:hypothetical protein